MNCPFNSSHSGELCSLISTCPSMTSLSLMSILNKRPLFSYRSEINIIMISSVGFSQSDLTFSSSYVQRNRNWNVFLIKWISVLQMTWPVKPTSSSTLQRSRPHPWTTWMRTRRAEQHRWTVFIEHASVFCCMNNIITVHRSLCCSDVVNNIIH